MVFWPRTADRNIDVHAALCEQVLDVCVRRVIPCLDLRPTIAATPADTAPWLTPYAGHPNAFVTALAGEAMLAWLDRLLTRWPVGASARGGELFEKTDTGH